jgi:hypothetical protein
VGPFALYFRPREAKEARRVKRGKKDFFAFFTLLAFFASSLYSFIKKPTL